MRNILLRLMLASMLFALTTFAGAQAHEHVPLRFTIPFDFIAGDTVLPAGDYTVSSVSADMELISGKGGQLATLAPAALKGPAGSNGLLVFHQIGDKYFLAEVWPAGSKTGRLVSGSSSERRMKNSLVAQQVTVIAGGTK